jgi:hypothetical protein
MPPSPKPRRPEQLLRPDERWQRLRQGGREQAGRCEPRHLAWLLKSWVQ